MAERPKWLPDLWSVEVRRRTDGRIDKYFIDPESNYIFRSKLDVIHYLDTGEIRNKVYKRNPSSNKASSSELILQPAAVEQNNGNVTTRPIPFQNQISSFQQTHEGVVGGHQTTLEVQVTHIEQTCKSREIQTIVTQGISEVSQDVKPDQVIGESMESMHVSANVRALGPAELTQQRSFTEHNNLKKDYAITGKSLKRKLINCVPVRRSPRNKGVSMNLSAEVDGMPQCSSPVPPLHPVLVKSISSVEMACKQVVAELVENGEESKKECKEVSRLSLDGSHKLSDIYQVVSLPGNGCGLSKENQLKSATENLIRSGGDASHDTPEMQKTGSSNKLGSETHHVLLKENGQKSSKQMCKRDLGILRDSGVGDFETSKNIDAHDTLGASEETTKGNLDMLFEPEKQLVEVAEEKNELVTESIEIGEKSKNRSKSKSSGRAKMKAASNLPRCTSRRLVGTGVNTAVEIVCESSAEKIHPDASILGDTVNVQATGTNDSAAVPVLTDITIPHPFSINSFSESEMMTKAPILSKLVNDKWLFEHENREMRQETTPMVSEQKDLESSISYPFGDPCIEFAFKTLTGDLPIFEDVTAIENYFHQHLSSPKNCYPSSPPHFTLNTMQPETPVQVDNLGRFTSNAGRVNQERTLKSGLQSSDINSRLESTKMN